MKHPATLACLLLGALLWLAGCQLAPRDASRPGRTKLTSPLVVLPVEKFGHVLIVTTSWDRHGPYRFLIDTGSSLTHVSPELAQRYRVKNAPPTGIPPVRVRSANGDTLDLPTTVITQIKLGDALFSDVPAAIYDCSALSAHFGVKIDGILGYPLFRDARLTLDYPHAQLILAPAKSTALAPGTPIAIIPGQSLPIIPVKLAEQNISVLVDSGSEAALNLNPNALNLSYRANPRPAVLVGTLGGNHLQECARLNEPLLLGGYTVPAPIVYLNDSLNAIGGELLSQFSLTFDQTKQTITFQRESRTPITVPSKRGTGLSFSKTPAYWRVVGVVPDSPATWVGVQPGELVSRINGEPVAQWTFSRYAQLIATAPEVTYTFLRGEEETDRTLSVFLLVP